jgi:hypothetical protein
VEDKIMNKTWKEVEKEFIKQNASILKDAVVREELQKLTGRTISLQAIRKQRQKMGLLKVSGRGYCKLKTTTNVESPKSDISKKLGTIDPSAVCS